MSEPFSPTPKGVGVFRSVKCAFASVPAISSSFRAASLLSPSFRHLAPLCLFAFLNQVLRRKHWLSGPLLGLDNSDGCSHLPWTFLFSLLVLCGEIDMSTTKEGDTRISLVMSELKYR